LRDLFGAQTIAGLTDRALLSQGGSGAHALGDAEEFLLRVRSILHLEARRHYNVLSHEMQERVAERLEYAGARTRPRVERLMGEYSRHARSIHRTLKWTLRSAPQPVGSNLVSGVEGVRFVDSREAAARPESWLALFETALENGCGVADASLVAIQQHVGRFTPEDVLPSRAHRAAVLRFLKPRVGLYDRLSEMHDAGLLGQIFPEFKAISSRVVRDFYHKYTVDEHTLLTIRNLERLLMPEKARQRFSRLLFELSSP